MADELLIDIGPYTYQGNQAPINQHITINFSDTDIIAIIGPSGCGKSTLLKLIAKLLLNGNCHLSADVKISYLFQEPRLMPWLTVAQNIQLVNSGLTDQELYDLLSQLEIAECASLYPKQLSGGQQRRVAIARAFCIQPELLLLDEPFVSLDAPTALDCRRLLIDLQIKHQNKILLVTHDLEEAIMLSQKCLFLSTQPTHVLLTLDSQDIRRQASAMGQSASQYILSHHPDILSGK